MKTTFSSLFLRRRGRGGMALISVLAVLFLATLLVVAFLARTTGARAAAANFNATAQTRVLADTAVNFVQAQINEATMYGLTASGALSGTSFFTWASQPGVIRVFGARNASNTTGLTAIYRLYSATPTTASTARTTATLTDLANDLPTTGSWTGGNWTTYGAQWVDLNSFVKDSEGKYHFPIVDPRDPLADPTVIPTSTAIGTLWQPLGGNLPLAGFYINQPSAMVPATPVNPAAMPVRWLYILKDGSIISPDSPGTPSNVLQFTKAVNALGTADPPTVKDPIVGRIAFWTDDDSSKININTAAGDDVVRGTNQYAADSIFWDTPYFSTPDEVNLAIYQPAAGEIQRYPGAPATVGLNTTLSTLMGRITAMPYDDFLGLYTASYNSQGAATSYTIENESLLPRYIGGGSESATVAIPYTGVSTGSNILPSSRLYTSLAEMLFKATPSGQLARSESVMAKSSNDMVTTEADAVAAVERSEFFLTAHSSSPELNLFGEPRVSIWPWTTTPPSGSGMYQTPEDQLLAFDSSFRNGTSASTEQDFYFQRRDPTSSVTDCTIPNNESIFNYLDKLTSLAIPGFGTSLQSKYPNTYTPPRMRQILAEIFDYVRTTNMLDPVIYANSPVGLPSHTYGQNWGDNTKSPVFVLNAPSRSNAGGVQVVPSANAPGGGLNGWHVQGLGAFPIPVEVTLHFVAMGTGYVPKVGTTFPAQPENPIPSQQYDAYNLASDVKAGTADDIVPETSQTASDEFLAQCYGGDMTIPKSIPPANPRKALPGNPTATPPVPASPNGNATAELWDPPQGKPANWSTAMQCFVYVSFINPGVIESHDQPMFCFSLTGLNSFSVTDPANSGASIPLHFPGTLNSSASAGSSTDEQVCIVDNSDGGGFINGWIGDWIFGYIPWMGETGDDNYGGNPGMLSPNPISTATWNINNVVKVAPSAVYYPYMSADGKTVNPPPSDAPAPLTVNGRLFPFYSQLFGVSGIQGESSGNGNPNGTSNFNFSGGTLTLKMYDANRDGQTISATNVVTSVPVVIPKGTFPLPIYSPNNASDSHIIGTLTDQDYGGTVLVRPPNADESPTGDDPDSDALCSSCDRWHQSADAGSGVGDYANRISADDTVKSMTLSSSWSDARDLAINVIPTATSGVFATHPNWALTTAGYPGQAHDLLEDSALPIIGNLSPSNWGRLLTQTPNNPSDASYSPVVWTNQAADAQINYPIVPPRLNGPLGAGTSGQGAYTAFGTPGDWDTGIAYYPDGPWINMADEGAQTTNVQQDDSTGGAFDQGASYAYYSTGNLAQKTGLAASFSPNREMPSPVMFGSLPTGVSSSSPDPWQTLLFHPGPFFGGFRSTLHAIGEPNMSSTGVITTYAPADHLLLDLFWMPQAEPYPISQTFVTEGKINLNYEIQPFTYITRDTALRALLGSVKVAVMPDAVESGGFNYKVPGTPYAMTAAQITAGTGNRDVNGNTRLPIDIDQTLGLNPRALGDPHQPTAGTATTTTGQTSVSATQNAAWYDYVAKTTRFFKSPSEICEMFLVPQGYDWEDFTGFNGLTASSWYRIPGGDFALVGDNLRERPYADIYSRVTTKSNTYTVYYTVQSLRNAEPQINSSGVTPGQQIWDESKGNVTGEYRGSTMIERYLDPNQSLPQYLDPSGGTLEAAAGTISLEAYYKWRVLSTRQFAP